MPDSRCEDCAGPIESCRSRCAACNAAREAKDVGEAPKKKKRLRHWERIVDREAKDSDADMAAQEVQE